MENDVAEEVPNPFDVNTVRQLVGLMSKHDLSEIDLSVGDQRIRLRRGAFKTTVTNLAPLPAVAAPPASAAALATKPAGSETPAAPAKKLIDIKSPTPGTFYSRPSPDADVFVKVARGWRPRPSSA